MELHPTVTCYVGFHSVPVTRHKWTYPALTPTRGRYAIYLPRRDGRLSWPWWLVTYRNGLLAQWRSPIQVLTRGWPKGELTTCWSQVRCPNYTTKPHDFSAADTVEVYLVKFAGIRKNSTGMHETRSKTLVQDSVSSFKNGEGLNLSYDMGLKGTKTPLHMWL